MSHENDGDGPTPPLPTARMSTVPPPLRWFRPSVRALVLRAWAQSFGFVLAGSVILGLLRVERVDFGSPWLVVYGVGILLVMTGPLWLATRLARTLRRERVLTLHADGLRWTEGEETPAFIPWEATERFEPSTEGFKVVHEQGVLNFPSTFEDIEPAELAKELEAMRRRRLMGLPLRP